MKNSLIKKYLNAPFWILFSINTILYIIIVFIEYQFILTNKYYDKHLKPLFDSNEDYLAALNDEKKVELYNYLWCPVHVFIQLILTSFCFYIGFNALNKYLSLKDSIRSTMLALIVFPINNLIITTLQATGVIQYDRTTSDDLYFFQSLGSLFAKFKLPDFIFSLLEMVNIVEITFCLIISITLSFILKIKYKITLLQVFFIYSIGTTIYILVMQFCKYLLIN